MKKILLTVLLASTVLASANANAWCCHRGGYYGRGWVGPALGGVVAGAIVGSALSSPYYGAPYYYGPRPVIVEQQPVFVQPPVIVQQQPIYVQQGNRLPPAPAGYHWAVMTNPQTNAAQEVLVPN